MAKLLSSIKRFIGTSKEIKPTNCPNGSTFLEEDIGDMYVFRDGSWFLKDAATRIHLQYLLKELLAEAKKTNELLETVASSLND